MMAIRRYHQKNSGSFHVNATSCKNRGKFRQQVKSKLCRINCPLIKKAFFYLNVLDIPPNSPEQEGKNALKFAMQNRIKLFYRPAGIAPVNKATFKSYW